MTSGLTYRTESLADLYLGLREESNRAAPKPDWKPAVEALRSADTSLTSTATDVRMSETQGTDLRMRLLIDGLICGCQTLDEFEALVSKAATGAGMLGKLAPKLGQLAEAMRLGAEAYVGERDQRQQTLDAARRYLESTLDPLEGQCLTFILSGLEIPDPGYEVPVMLVVDAPAPGAFTARSHRGEVFCCAGVTKLEGSTLIEAILHEAIHALETAAGTSDHSVLGQLRSGLADAGIDSTDSVHRDLPHTLFFVHAAETVRRIVDPDHIDYGDSHHYYAKLPTIAQVVRENWKLHLDGKSTAAETVEQMITEAISKRNDNP